MSRLTYNIFVLFVTECPPSPARGSPDFDSSVGEDYTRTHSLPSDYIKLDEVLIGMVMKDVCENCSVRVRMADYGDRVRPAGPAAAESEGQ